MHLDVRCITRAYVVMNEIKVLPLILCYTVYSPCLSVLGFSDKRRAIRLVK